MLVDNCEIDYVCFLFYLGFLWGIFVDIYRFMIIKFYKKILL